jgi:drug/metabolite transporter (DMT)-like permease
MLWAKIVIPLLPVRPSAFKIHLSLFIVAAIYAVSYTLAKEVMPEYILPKGFILLRIAGALACIFLYHTFFIREKVKSIRDYLHLALCAFFGVALNMVMFFEGLSRTSPIHAPLIMVTTPILVLVIGFLFREEKLTALKIFGVVLGTLGAGLLISGRAGGDREATFLGDILVMINAAAFAVYLVIVKPLMKKYHPITVSLWTFIFGFIFVLPVGLQDLTIVNWHALTYMHWSIIVFMIFCTTFLAYTLNAWAIQYVKSSVVGSYIYLQPVLGIALAVSTGKYTLHWMHLIYAALIFAGVYLVSRKRNEQMSE